MGIAAVDSRQVNERSGSQDRRDKSERGSGREKGGGGQRGQKPNGSSSVGDEE